MELYERVRYLRKNELKLSQEKFGAVLGVNRDVINNIELNRLAKPEQKEPLVKLISKTFNVNYEWLSSGQGEMYVKTKDAFIEKLSEEYGLGFYAKKVLEVYMNLDDEQQDTVEYFLQTIIETATAEKEDIPVKMGKYSQKPARSPELEREADEFAKAARELFLEEKKQENQISFAQKLDAS